MTYVYSEIENEGITLTPNYLIRGSNLNQEPRLNLGKNKSALDVDLEKMHKNLVEVKNYFWKIWNEEYLTDLFERHIRNKKAAQNQVVPEMGEIVLIKEALKPRKQWKLGRIIKIINHRGIIREVLVQTLSDNKNEITIIKRHPAMLIPLEIKSKIIQVNPKLKKQILKTKQRNREKKLSKLELIFQKKHKIWPPYKKSKQFKNPDHINTGPEQDYVDAGGQRVIMDDELPRSW